MQNSAFMCKNRHGVYYARFIIPKHLQSHFNNKKEVRRTLQTDSRKLAIKRTRVYRVEFEKIVDELMTKLEKGTYIAFETSLKGETSITLPNGEKKTITGEIKRNLGSIDEDTSKHKEHLLKQLSTEAERQEKNAYLEHERAIKEKREEELHQAQLKAIALSVQFTAPAPPINAKLLSEYLVDYIKHQTNSNLKKGKKDGKGWSDETKRNKGTALTNSFIKYCDKPAASFDWQDAKRLIEITELIPTNFENPSHSKKFKDSTKDLTIEMLLDVDVDTSMYETRAPSTIANILKTYRAFLNWIATDQKVKALLDPIETLDETIREIDIESKKRPFEPEELKTLFEENNPSDENYVKGFSSKRVIDANLKYWLPLLSLYTGATLAELCQLHLSDIHQHEAFDGSQHWVIDLNEFENKRLKNKYRARLIPVNKVLINLGFIDYVQSLSSTGEVALFPTAKRSSGGNGYFMTEGQWWGIYSDNAGITDRDVTFHSFRHVVTTYLDKIHCEAAIMSAILGHGKQSTLTTYYSKGGYRVKDIAPLVVAINKIDYGLNHHPFKLAP
jgi:integrase